MELDKYEKRLYITDYLQKGSTTMKKTLGNILAVSLCCLCSAVFLTACGNSTAANNTEETPEAVQYTWQALYDQGNLLQETDYNPDGSIIRVTKPSENQ